MKALIDTGVWLRNNHNMPMRAALVAFMTSPEHDFYLCPLSITEVVIKWNKGKLNIDPPETWLAEGLKGYTMAHLTPDVCLQAGLWEWDHWDMVDRLLAALALKEGLTLIHTDAVLKELPGFPQKYFPNTN